MTPPGAATPGPPGDPDVWIVVGAAVLGASAGLLWGAGELGARLVHGRLPAVGPSGAVAAAVGVLAHPARPGEGWPAGAGVPGPLVYWATVAVLVAAGGAVGVALLGAVRRLRGVAPGRGRRRGLATPAQLRAELSPRARRRLAGAVRPSLGRRR